jgi:hypothetical protein
MPDNAVYKIIYVSVSETVVRGPPVVCFGRLGGLLEVLEKLHQTQNEWKIHSYMSVIKLALLI